MTGVFDLVPYVIINCMSSCMHVIILSSYLQNRISLFLSNSELQNIRCTWIVAVHKSPLPPLPSWPFFSRIMRIFTLELSFLENLELKMLAVLGQLYNHHLATKLHIIYYLPPQSINPLFSYPSFIWKIGKKFGSLGKFTPNIRKVGGET